MSLPHRPVAVVSLVAAYGATAYWRRGGSAAVLGADALPSTSSVSLSTSFIHFVTAFVAAYLLQALAYGIWSILLYPFYFSPLRHLPQPTDNVFLVGQWFKITQEETGKPALDWINSIPNDGLIRYLGLFNQERLIITKPKALAEVLVSKNYDFIKPTLVRQQLSRLLGVGVLLAEGDEHRFQRKLLAPAFAFRHIKDLYPVFWRKARESVVGMRRAMAQRQKEIEQGKRFVPAAAAAAAAAGDSEKADAAWAKEAATSPFALEIGGWASRATLDIIGVAGLGRDFGALRDPDNELAATYRTLLSPNRQARILGLLGLVLPRWFVTALPVRRNGDLVAASRFLRNTCADLVREKKAKLAQAHREAGANDGAVAVDVDILSVALESGGFSDANLADQLMTFLAAGHETTASAMTWAIYLLSVHPDVQERLRAEVRAGLPPLGDDPARPDFGAGASADASSVDVDHLPYLSAVCSEVLRVLSPVPMTLRETAVDTTIQGQFVPRGTRIMLVPWAVNKSEDLWGPSARVFDPERWLQGGGGGGAAAPGKEDGSSSSAAAASNYAFLTFLHGPRSCIGMHFARAEFACLLAAWVGRFEFRLQNPADADLGNIKIYGGVSARPKHGMHVYATPLEGW